MKVIGTFPSVKNRLDRQGHRASGFETRERLGAGSLMGRSHGHPSGAKEKKQWGLVNIQL